MDTRGWILAHLTKLISYNIHVGTACTGPGLSKGSTMLTLYCLQIISCSTLQTKPPLIQISSLSVV